MVSNSQNNKFDKSDLDLDPMTLMLKPKLDMVKMYYQTESEVSMSSHSKVIAQTDRQHYLTGYAGGKKITFDFFEILE